MRASEERFTRDMRRLTLAIRLIRLDARTRTVAEWSGLTIHRVRTLYRSPLADIEQPSVTRPRGPAPYNIGCLTGSANLRSEVGAAAVLCRALGVYVPGERVTPNRVISLARGERLCLAYEVYSSVVPAPKLSIEHLALLVRELVSGERVTLGACVACDGAIVIDRLRADRPVCAVCGGVAVEEGARAADVCESGPASHPASVQKNLF